MIPSPDGMTPAIWFRLETSVTNQTVLGIAGSLLLIGYTRLCLALRTARQFHPFRWVVLRIAIPMRYQSRDREGMYLTNGEADS